MLNLNSGASSNWIGRMIFVISCLTLLPGMLLAQAPAGTGSIRGTVSDDKGAAVAGAKVTITNQATAGAVQWETSATGLYSSGPLQPGTYVVQAEAKGFEPAHSSAQVRLGEVTTTRLVLAGQKQPAITELAPQSLMNFEQPTVQGVLFGRQLNDFPLNGRNPFDLAQLEPGVQFTDGAILFPGKNDFLFPSMLGQTGRGLRFEVDGVDISDEIVGSTTQNVSAGAIQEFNLTQSSPDFSAEVTSGGIVNIATRSGSNALHGEAFGWFSGNETAARFPGIVRPTFDREQFGARAGGSVIKDKLFWFLDVERTKQDLTAGEPFAFPFAALPTSLAEPLRAWQGDGRLDWQLHDNAHAFYRFSFDENTQTGPFGSATSLQAYRNQTRAPSHTLGYDFRHGSYMHSIRIEYLKSRDGLFDTTASLPAGVDNPIPGIGINIGAGGQGSCALSQGGAYCGGPSYLSPQTRFQSDWEFRYDGTRVRGNHIFQYGALWNRMQAAASQAFTTSPQVGTASICLPGTAPTTCLTSSDPTAYAADFVRLGNGIGFSTPQSAFGRPAGGLGPDNRFEAYVGDSWKANQNLTLTYGVHYTRDTARTDANLGPEPALNLWSPTLGGRVRQPNTNYAPQFGFAWDSGGNGKTVIRGGAGLFFADSLWSNLLADSAVRRKNGNFAYTPQVCSYGVPTSFTWPTSPGGLGAAVAGGAGLVVAGANQVQPTFCGGTISAVASDVLALSSAFQAAAAANSATQPNPNYVGKTLNASNANGFDVFDPNYRAPRAWQMNLGFQREIRPGTVLSLDYVRNIGEHYLLAIDQNHSGAARSYNQALAQKARDTAQIANGCSPGYNQAQCMIQRLGLANAQAAYSAAGLDSNIAVTGGAPCNFCAFPGVTPLGQNNSGNGVGNGSLGALDTLEPIGRSVYGGFQFRLVQSFKIPAYFVKAGQLQLAYAYSKYVSQVPDQDTISLPTNNDNPLQFTGPNGLDRKHQFTFGTTLELPFFTHVSMIAHFYSPLPESLLLPQLTNGGEIFASDWLGSGLGSGAAPEPLPGTNIGQFMRGSDISALQTVINNYNTHFAGTLTPAGHCLVADQSCPGFPGIQVMTMSDMTSLGWVMPQVGSVPPGAMNFPWLKSLDLKAAWPIKFRDRITVEPSASIFNVFNLENAILPGNLPLASLLPGSLNNTTLAPNAVGGITPQNQTPFRANFQSGTYALGAPRLIQFGLRIEF